MEVRQILARLYVERMDEAIVFYEDVLATNCEMRFALPGSKVEVARIGGLLLFSGSKKALQPFRNTQATFEVDSLADYQEYLERNGGEVLRGPLELPVGKIITIRHEDGVVVDYAERG